MDGRTEVAAPKCDICKLSSSPIFINDISLVLFRRGEDFPFCQSVRPKTSCSDITKLTITCIELGSLVTF